MVVMTYRIFVRWMTVAYGLTTNRSVAYLRDCGSSWGTEGGYGDAALDCTVLNCRVISVRALMAFGRIAVYDHVRLWNHY